MKRGVRRKEGVTYERSGDTVLILDADGTVLTSLNSVGSVIWDELDGQRCTADLARDLVDRFDGVDEGTLMADIDAFVESLLAADLVESD